MHRLKGEYYDSNDGYECSIQVVGGKPYVLLNLEEYWEQLKLDGEHCDLLYVCEKNDKLYVFIVELKDINDENVIMDISIRRDLKQSLENKFRNTLTKLNGNRGLLSLFGINMKNVEIIGVFVVPWEIVSLIKRKKIHFTTLRSINRFHVVGCGSDIWSR